MSALHSLTLAKLASYAVQVALLLVVATFVFDCIHYVLHQFLKSRFALLRALGGLHQVHHDFYDRNLGLNDEHLRGNLVKHVLPEYTTQVCVTSVAFLFLEPYPVVATLLLETGVFIATLLLDGKDPNHQALSAMRAPPHTFLVSPMYHAGHHVFPETNFGSYTSLFDCLMGTGTPLKGRRVVLTGASGAFGAPLKGLLEREGARVDTLKFGTDYTYSDYSRADALLRDADILVLAHGSKREQAMQANCDSFVALIERFRALAVGRKCPPEVWAVGSEIEAHPSFGNETLRIYSASKRAFAQHAWWYFRDRSLVYRHIVPSAFSSRMGPGLISGETAARIALFFIRRGFRYVPVTYTGIAFLNALKFFFNKGRPPVAPKDAAEPLACSAPPSSVRGPLQAR